MKNIHELVARAGAPLWNTPPKVEDWIGADLGPTGEQLFALLSQRNGFYAFDSALHVFPSRSDGETIGLDGWNSDELWRFEYGDLAEGLFFFAEDLFGSQFCIREGQVYAFDPETAALELMGEDLEGWAAAILADVDFRTGRPLARAWQQMHGPLPPGRRLYPKMPFVVGGEYALSNLYAGDPVERMGFHGSLATQIRDLPDGTPIRFEITD